MRRATELAPERAGVWIDLGVALESTGDIGAAATAAHRALEVDPQRATAWVNLARLQLRAGDRANARRVLDLARRARVADPRLDELSEAMSRDGAPPE
jgi:Flp pilus assembly protein TadD